MDVLLGEVLNESEIVQRFDKLAQIIYSQLVTFFEAQKNHEHSHSCDNFYCEVFNLWVDFA